MLRWRMLLFQVCPLVLGGLCLCTPLVERLQGQEHVHVERWTMGKEADAVACIRLNHDAPAKGTVFVLPGKGSAMSLRTKALARLADRSGWEVYSLDWRGQGESGRWRCPCDLVDTPSGGFEDYIQDMRSLIAYANERHCPRPWVCIGRSLGGHIGLRLQQEAPCFDGMILHAPAIVPRTPPFPLWCAQSLVRIVVGLGFSSKPIPLIEDQPHWASQAVREFYQMHPECLSTRLTWGWVHALFRSCHVLQNGCREHLDLPLLVFMGSRDTVVENDATQRLLGAFPQCTMLFFDCQHHLGRDPIVCHAIEAEEQKFLEAAAWIEATGEVGLP